MALCAPKTLSFCGKMNGAFFEIKQKSYSVETFVFPLLLRASKSILVLVRDSNTPASRRGLKSSLSFKGNITAETSVKKKVFEKSRKIFLVLRKQELKNDINGIS